MEKRKGKFIEAGYEGAEYKNKVFHAHILEQNLLPLFRTPDNIHYQLPQSIKTDIQFTNQISKQNLFSTIFPEFNRFDEGNWQPCILTKNNVGWITKDKDGYYRYRSKSSITGVIYGFSLLDLIEISHIGEYIGTKLTYQTDRKWLATILNLSYRDFNFVKQQKVKYQRN
ncbi:hypothetical protein ACFYKT_18255 [Cytobacillus sp. FJAT-53684]|uniref:Uncharacterized protein n=1 Tax=Cytobacillus mangrovibacter TaxID=3299024 RepID=A0ABW6K282_9BACI